MRRYVAGAILLSMLTAVLAFSQNAQLGGIVTDPSGALVPGVTITVTNTDTGVVTTTLTNEVRSLFISQPSTGKAYRVERLASGLPDQDSHGLELASSVRQNFQLQLSTAQTTVEVSADAISAISANSASVGDVLPETRINNLPNRGKQRAQSSERASWPSRQPRGHPIEYDRRPGTEHDEHHTRRLNVE